MRQAAAGALLFTGGIVQRIGGLVQVVAGHEVFSGPVAQRLGGIQQIAVDGNARPVKATATMWITINAGQLDRARRLE